MEEVGILDPASEVEVCDLHFIYLPIIQCQVDMFCEVWCNHPLCRAHNRTPHQLWILGLAQAKIETPTSRAVLGVTGITLKKTQIVLEGNFHITPICKECESI